MNKFVKEIQANSRADTHKQEKVVICLKSERLRTELSLIQVRNRRVRTRRTRTARTSPSRRVLSKSHTCDLLSLANVDSQEIAPGESRNPNDYPQGNVQS